MLDYILSKMVLLVFLVLLISAFSYVRETANAYFTARSGKLLADRITDAIHVMIVSANAQHEHRALLLPNALDVGNKKLPYEMNVLVYSAGGSTRIGVAIVDPATGRVTAFGAVSLPKGFSARACGDGFSVSAFPGGTKQTYLILEKDLDTARGEIKICVSDNPQTSCPC